MERLLRERATGAHCVDVHCADNMPRARPRSEPCGLALWPARSEPCGLRRALCSSLPVGGLDSGGGGGVWWSGWCGSARRVRIV